MQDVQVARKRLLCYSGLHTGCIWNRTSKGACRERGVTMRPYSNDLRERIVAAMDRQEHSLRQIAQLFSVGLSFVVRLSQRRATGSVRAKSHAGGPKPKIDAAAVQLLLELVH
jgi:transposase-like protein